MHSHLSRCPSLPIIDMVVPEGVHPTFYTSVTNGWRGLLLLLTRDEPECPSHSRRFKVYQTQGLQDIGKSDKGVAAVTLTHTLYWP